MKVETALQLLILEFKQMGYHAAANKAAHYLAIEKSQIMEAWDLGGHCVAHKDENYSVDSEEYFDNKYEQYDLSTCDKCGHPYHMHEKDECPIL